MKTLLLLLVVSMSFALDMEAMVEHLKFEEGFRAHPYKCSRGYLTIGYGHRCAANTKPVTREQAEAILRADINIAIKNVHKLVGTDQPDTVEFVLVSMTFQLGYAGVRDFKNMLRNIRGGNYVAASGNMIRSDWKKQTPERCFRLANLMKSVQ